MFDFCLNLIRSSSSAGKAAAMRALLLSASTALLHPATSALAEPSPMTASGSLTGPKIGKPVEADASEQQFEQPVSSQSLQPALPQTKPFVPKLVNIVLEGKPVRDHNLEALSQLIYGSYGPSEVAVFISPVYFLSGDQSSAAKLMDFIDQHKGQIRVGVHLSGHRTLVENSGVSFRTGPTFWGYALDGNNCHELCGIEVPLLGYTANEQDAIIKTAVKTLAQHLGHPIRDSLVEGGMFTKSLAARLLHSGITTDHTLAGKSPADYYDIRHFPLYSWLGRTGTLNRLARHSRHPRCALTLGTLAAKGKSQAAAGGCKVEANASRRVVQHIYHNEAFMLISSGATLLSH